MKLTLSRKSHVKVITPSGPSRMCEHLQFSWQRLHTLLGYLKILSVGPVHVKQNDSPCDFKLS